jgi:hypothetical protein
MKKWALTNTWEYFTRNTTDPKGDAAKPALGELTAPTVKPACQFIKEPLTTPDAEIMAVTRSGELTLWLANSAKNDRNDDLRWQGWLFLDYIKLVPVLPEE